jgi:hypothetical protein
MQKARLATRPGAGDWWPCSQIFSQPHQRVPRCYEKPALPVQIVSKRSAPRRHSRMRRPRGMSPRMTFLQASAAPDLEDICVRCSLPYAVTPKATSGVEFRWRRSRVGGCGLGLGLGRVSGRRPLAPCPAAETSGVRDRAHLRSVGSRSAVPVKLGWLAGPGRVSRAPRHLERRRARRAAGYGCHCRRADTNLLLMGSRSASAENDDAWAEPLRRAFPRRAPRRARAVRSSRTQPRFRFVEHTRDGCGR